MAPSGASARGTAELLKVIKQSEFNVAAFVRDATGQGHDSVARLTQSLEECSSVVEEDLRREIVACHEELLQSAGSVDSLDGELAGVKEVVSALKCSVERVRGDVLSPFHCVKRRALLLQRMQEVNLLIRKLLRFLFHSKKLRTQMEVPTKDYSKVSHTLNELESVLQEGGLERVTVLRAEALWIRETGIKVRRQAEEDLRSGVRQGQQLALSTALQVFFNLQCLWPQLQRLLGELHDEFVQAALLAGTGFQQSLEVNLQILVAHMQRITFLDALVRSKVDPLTHRSFALTVEQESGSASLASRFWAEATKTFANKFARVVQDRTARKALLAEFPKVLNALAEAAGRVSLPGRGRGPALSAAEREALYAAVGDLRNEYLAESIKRVTEPVEMMLPNSLFSSLGASGETLERPNGASDDTVSDELPTIHDLRRYSQLLAAELERNEICPELLLKEAVRNVRSSVLLFATRLEQLVDSSCLELRCFEDETKFVLRSPLPMPVAGHARNARLFGIAHHTNTVLKDTIPARFQAVIVTQQVQSTLQGTQALVTQSMLTALRRVLLQACANIASSGSDGIGRTADGSTAMLAVSQAVSHASRYYFALFGSGQLQQHLKELCAFIVRAFLSAVALVKPCTEPERAEIAKDMQVVETMLSTLDMEFQVHIRHEVSVFQEFRKLLFVHSLEASALAELTNVLPVHLLLAYLVNQLPPETPSLPAFCGAGVGAYLEETLLPLWDEDPVAVAAFKSSIAALLAKHCRGGAAARSPAAIFLSDRCK
eukprot:gnl/TRDRNA2_/TRDRNA2_80938_c0_seq1.p1 gnl/TRDRNA2_/TRDRNA2_80938_c0~~gnl/TRDRNA2_/TRDRNA2_80938_c0_seq1.p1  ORF type:complete len:789 (+),score=171.28 gnl/TRDRNA2_/TRDRNA2_80938_c0_seq1:43-2367(+)